MGAKRPKSLVFNILRVLLQALLYMWVFSIGKLPEIVGHVITSFITYLGLMAVGLNTIQAVLRLLMVLQVDRNPNACRRIVMVYFFL